MGETVRHACAVPPWRTPARALPVPPREDELGAPAGWLLREADAISIESALQGGGAEDAGAAAEGGVCCGSWDD